MRRFVDYARDCLLSFSFKLFCDFWLILACFLLAIVISLENVKFVSDDLINFLLDTQALIVFSRDDFFLNFLSFNNRFVLF